MKYQLQGVIISDIYATKYRESILHFKILGKEKQMCGKNQLQNGNYDKMLC